MGKAAPSWDWAAEVRTSGPTNLSNLASRYDRLLKVDGVKFFVSVFDRAAMAIAEQSADANATVAFRPADSMSPTCIYAELAVHFRRMSIVEGNRTDWRVAVITRNSTLRSIHRRMSIGDHARLETIVPAETYSAGEFHRFGDSTVPGATVFLDSVSELQRIPRPHFVIVDAPMYGIGTCLDLGIPTMFVFRDLSEPRLLDLAVRIPTFGFSKDDVAAVSAAARGINPWIPKGQVGESRLETLAGGTSVVVHPVQSDTPSKWFDDLWNDLPNVARGAEHSSAGKELLGLSYRRFYDLTHMVVPIKDYVGQFGSLESRIRSVASASKLALRNDKELIPYIAEELMDYAHSLGDEPPKVAAFLELARRLVGADGVDSVRVAALNIETAQMLDSYLEDRMPESPSVVGLSALGQLEPVKHLILTGVPPTWARRILCAGIAAKVHVLAYTDAEGGSEAGVVRRIAGNFDADDKWLARVAGKNKCWSMLVGVPPILRDDHPDPPAAKEPGFEEEASVAPISLWSNLLTTTTSHQARSNGDSADVVDALRVTLADGRWALFAEDSNVTVLQDGRAEDGLPAGGLSVGDVLVIIDSDPRKALLDKLIEAGANVPQYAVVSEFTQIFRIAIATGYRQLGTYQAFLDALQAHGSKIISIAAVRGWVTGSTIGPKDREDVRRVGEIVGNATVATKYPSICDAVTRMRGIRVKLGRRLGAMAIQHGVDGALGVASEDELVDDVSGLTVGDFRSCIEYVRIQNIENFGEVPVELTGSLHNPEENQP